MNELRSVRIQLCGQLAVELNGRRVETALPSRQCRLLLAYLVTRRDHAVQRDELVDAVWPYRAPAASAVALKALLSKLRAALGPDVLVGRRDVRMALPTATYIDLEAALEAIHRAEAAIARKEWKAAYGPATVAQLVTARTFLPAFDAPWIDERRRELADVHLRALECTAALSIRIGGGELPTGERAARELVRRAPYRESAYLLLMEALRARGDLAEALRVYDALRVLLRDELGTVPSPAIQALHRTVLG